MARSKRKPPRALEALRESEERYRRLVEVSPDAIFINRDNKIVFINQAGLRLFGATRPEQMLGKSPFDFTHPAYHELVRHRIRRQLELGEAAAPVEQKVFRLDGTLVTVEVTAAPVVIGGVTAIQAVLRDITERKRAQEELEHANSLLRATLDSTADGILVVDRGGKITSYNRRFVELWRIPDAVVSTRDDAQALAFVLSQLRDPQGFLARVNELYAKPEEESFDLVEFADGRVIERYSQPQRIGAEIVGRVWSFRDVTERRRLEAQLRQAQKMEAIGRLAGGVAHDFNNLLAVIMGRSELGLHRVGSQDPLRQELEVINKTCERAAALTRQLLAFSRQQAARPRIVSLNTIVADMERMLRRVIAADVTLLTVMDPQLRPVKVDPAQIEQVLMNLVVNARDAMPQGGTLTIETANVVLDEAYCRSRAGIKPGRYALLAVSDTGCGMDAATQTRLFEPFFTTKEQGKGTGLGLSTVYGIVQQSGGHISVYSQPGQGSAFKVYLLHTAGAAVAAESSGVLQPVAGGTEIVLVVEDEEAVRELVRDALEMHGYTVLLAAHGGEALLASERRQGPIHLLLTDVMMPGLSGPELAERLAPQRPEMKLLFMSGYTRNGAVNNKLVRPALQFIEKPFTAKDLARRVREVLDRT